MLTVLWQRKATVSFSLEDKHVVNEHHVLKSRDAKQEKCPHVVHFNVPRSWFERRQKVRASYIKYFFAAGILNSKFCRLNEVISAFATQNSAWFESRFLLQYYTQTAHFINC